MTVWSCTPAGSGCVLVVDGHHFVAHDAARVALEGAVAVFLSCGERDGGQAVGARILEVDFRLLGGHAVLGHRDAVLTRPVDALLQRPRLCLGTQGERQGYGGENVS